MYRVKYSVFFSCDENGLVFVTYLKILGLFFITYIISYHIISYHIISYHIISYHIISYHIISYHIISYHIISYHISYRIVSYRITYHISHITYHISYIIYHIIYQKFNPFLSPGKEMWRNPRMGYKIHVPFCIS